VTELWSERAALYRDSPAHRAGPDLDLLVAWAEGGTALDVATGGGHVARRLREAGFEVVSCDPAVGMRPDVICRAEDLPFADSSFDVVTCRIAAHHFADIHAAMSEMARVSRSLALLVDNLYGGEHVEEAERLRDPTHVRCYGEAEWRALFAEADLRVEDIRLFEVRIELEPWLERAGRAGQDAKRVVELLRDRIDGGYVTGNRIALRGRK
jgi:SAM-dependent methyltransferase